MLVFVLFDDYVLGAGDIVCREESTVDLVVDVAFPPVFVPLAQDRDLVVRFERQFFDA